MVHETRHLNPEAAARKLIEIAAGIEPVQDGRIHIEKINASFLYALKASGAEFRRRIKHAVERGWLDLHESGTHVHLVRAVVICRRQLTRPDDPTLSQLSENLCGPFQNDNAFGQHHVCVGNRSELFAGWTLFRSAS